MPKFSVKKPMTVFVVVIMIIALGIVSILGMTPDLLPSIDLPYVVVMTTYPGATPEEVEATVTKPLE
ncbi:MAG: efflux RND transporter permease subunit, partial [Mailhella sp.]|nr:efflux RND transporter permease subunit [Mailhella sp.]